MNIPKAVGLKIASTLMFTVMGAQVRYLEGVFPVGQVAFFRSLFALIPIVLIFGWRGQLRGALSTEHPSAHFIRGLFSIVGTFCTFAALARIPIADFTAIAFLAPLITVIFAALFLKEHVHAYRWTAVAAGFVGVILMLTPYFKDHAALTSSASLGVLFAFVNAFSSGGATIQIRRITETETTATIVIFMTGIVMVASLFSLPFGWVMPVSMLQWTVLAGIGVAGGVAQMLFTDSYRYAPASFLAPFDYTSMLWAFLAGYWIFGEVPTLYVVVGALIVAGAGIFVILRERQLGLKRLRDTPVAAIASMADPEPDPDAPVTELAEAS
ncbi:MAG: DMT family transporter [Bradyrhizobiaceae bacterium]|nr:MAG: DMT family transporter [Bradyrhizobiaceae bacterium]